jgi:hypothetical protein
MNIFYSQSAVLTDHRGFLRPFSLTAEKPARGFVNPALVLFMGPGVRDNLKSENSGIP